MEGDADNNIPEWLLWQVLVRRPHSKHVVRCKVVSKQWASLISSPLFVRSYIISGHHSPSWAVIGRRTTTTDHNRHQLTFLQYDFPPDDHRLVSLRHIPPPPRTDASNWRYEVFGTSNGLVLFGLTKNDSLFDSIVMDIYYLCNPVTGELISIPPSGLGLLRAPRGRWGPGLVTRIDNATAALESFRVVLLLTDAQAQGCVRFCVYASETVEWEEFVLPVEVPHGRISAVPFTLDDRIVLWLTDEKDGSAIAYDPYHHPDRLRLVEPPADDLQHGASVVGGKLMSYFEHYRDGSARFKLWVLEDRSRWRLSHEASGVRLKGDGRFLPKFLDGDVLFLANERRLVSYELKTGKVRVVEEYTDDGLRSGKKLVMSSLAFLVRLSPWPISIGKGIRNHHPLMCSSPQSVAAPNGDIVVGSSCKRFLDYLFSNLPDENEITLLAAACCALVLFCSY